jgi:EAL domain-containing protein (putative c-di-GMP-specific phosphodiesterase class I)
MRLNLKDIAQKLLFFFVISVVTVFTFELSQFFVSQADRVHIISITAAFITASQLRFGKKVIPAIASALLYQYIIISQRPIDIALSFSLFYPLISLLFIKIYYRASSTLSQFDYTLKATYYIGIMGVLYPVVATISMIHLADFLNYPFMSTPEYLAYSALGSSISQLLLTPLLFIFIGFPFKEFTNTYLSLDRAMRKINSTPGLYWAWICLCSLTIIFALLSNDPLVLNALCLLLVPIIGLGVGNFGIILPYCISTLICLISAENAVYNYNQGIINPSTFYSMIAILFAITTLILLLSAQSVKNFLTNKAAIEKERRDPYTGLFSISQLSHDLSQSNDYVMIYIDLAEISNRLHSLGFEGKALLMRNVSEFICDFTHNRGVAYLPPFSQGILYLLPNSPSIRHEIKDIAQALVKFKFQWQEQSIQLINQKIVCCKLEKNIDKDLLLSTLCTPNENFTQGGQINWVVLNQNEERKIDKLSRIQSAFDDNKFILFCQPYLDLKQPNSPLYFEVLIRLSADKKDQNPLSPAEFFPLVNEFGLQVKLDKWVIKHTFKALHLELINWQVLGRCSINLTAQALNDTTLSDYICSLAKKYEIPLEKICFEITESAALTNEKQAVNTIEHLRLHGCKIALDDFGTGYASFDYLRRLPIDILKIDGSFVRNITENKVDQTIVNTISQVAQGMSLITVAEFVESTDHIALLRSMDIHYAQGYAIAKPLPLKELLMNKITKQDSNITPVEVVI